MFCCKEYTKGNVLVFRAEMDPRTDMRIKGTIQQTHDRPVSKTHTGWPIQRVKHPMLLESRSNLLSRTICRL